MTRIIATISPDGTTTFRVEGVDGPSCMKLTASLQKVLGTTTRDIKTGEYYQTEGTTERRVVSE